MLLLPMAVLVALLLTLLPLLLPLLPQRQTLLQTWRLTLRFSLLGTSPQICFCTSMEVTHPMVWGRSALYLGECGLRRMGLPSGACVCVCVHT